MAKPKFESFKPSEHTRVIPIDLIDLNDFNPNEMDDYAFDRLLNEMREIGRLIDPIQVVPKMDGRFLVLGGAHRFRAAQNLGWTEIPATLLSEERWQEKDIQKITVVKLNVLKGKLNPEKMAKLYEEMADKYGKESLQNLFAFCDADAWDHLVKGVEAGIKKSLPKGIADKFDKAAKDAKSVNDLSLIINQLFAEYGDTVDSSFMVFTYGGKEHVYIAMTDETRDALRKVVAHCKKYSKDINTIMAPVTLEWVKSLAKAEKEGKPAEPSKKSKPDVSGPDF